jgi:hypothetical protein
MPQKIEGFSCTAADVCIIAVLVCFALRFAVKVQLLFLGTVAVK